jgi:hypothetical protein
MQVKTIKFLNKSTILLNKVKYKGYLVGELPKKFAFIYNEEEDKEGITEWFNYKGLTYVEQKKSIWDSLK